MYSRQERLKFVTEGQCSLGLSPKQKVLRDKENFLIIENSKGKKKTRNIFETAHDSDE